MTLEQQLTEGGFMPQDKTQRTYLENLYYQRDRFERLYTFFAHRKHEPNIHTLRIYLKNNAIIYDNLILKEEQERGDNK